MMDKQDIAALLIGYEKSLLTNDVRSSLVAVDLLLHEDFSEISQSGGCYGKQDVLDAFGNVPVSGSDYKASNFNVRFISPEVAQVTFETISIPKADTSLRKALRSSLWKYEGGRWQMIFHQGTIAA